MENYRRITVDNKFSNSIFHRSKFRVDSIVVILRNASYFVGTHEHAKLVPVKPIKITSQTHQNIGSNPSKYRVKPIRITFKSIKITSQIHQTTSQIHQKNLPTLAQPSHQTPAAQFALRSKTEN